jgi:hypothetical protein
MKRPSRIPLAALLGALALAAPAARANLTPPRSTVIGGGGGIQPPGLCPPASVAYCSNPANQGTTCWATNTADCARTLKSAFDAAWHDLTSGPTPPDGPPHGLFTILLPENMSSGGRLIGGAREPYDQRQIRFVDSDYTYESLMAFRQLPWNFGSWADGGRTARTTPLHPDWEAEGTLVSSCADYVYKTYYDYSRFEDAAASCKEDWICIYNVAVLGGNPGIGMYPLRKDDLAHAPMDVQLRRTVPAYTQAKNAFTLINPAIFYDVISYRRRSDVAVGLGPISLAAPYTITDRWVWHTTVHDSQASYGMTLAEYADIEVRTTRYAELVAAYRDLYGRLAAAPGGAGSIYQILHPSAVASTRCADPPAFDPVTGDPLPCRHPLPGSGPPSWPPDSLAGQLQEVVNDLRDMLIAEWDHHSVADGITVDHGCLDAASTRCDWSPKLFAKEYQGLWKAERERSFQHCIDGSGDNFTPANYPSVNPSDQADCDAFDRWLANAVVVRGALLKDLPWTTDGDGRDVVGRDTHGGKQLGDPRYFYVDYGYRAGYSVSFGRASDGTTICNAQGRIGGGLSAKVSIAALASMTVLDAALDARAGQGGDATAYAQGHLIVFDRQLYSSGGEVRASDFNLSPASPSDLSKSAGFDMIIPVAGVIPVHLHAGVEFQTGLGWSVDGEAPQTCDTSSPLMDLHGSISPYAKVSGVLSAALGVEIAGLGAEAGVRGNLDLLEASMPVTVSLGLGAALNDDGHVRPSLTLGTSASIDLTALSGTLNAYAEVCVLPFVCESAEKEIYSWHGVHLDHMPLFALTRSFPLIVLNTARR